MKTGGRLTDMATVKALLEGAETAARGSGDELPGPEHLVLSAIDLPEGSARRAFLAIGADPELFAGAIESAHREALRAVGVTPPPASTGRTRTLPRPTGLFRSTVAAQEVFHAAVLMAKRPEWGPLRGAHVLAAACDVEQGTVARAFAVMGVDRRALAAAAAEEAGHRR